MENGRRRISGYDWIGTAIFFLIGATSGGAFAFFELNSSHKIDQEVIRKVWICAVAAGSVFGLYYFLDRAYAIQREQSQQAQDETTATPPSTTNQQDHQAVAMPLLANAQVPILTETRNESGLLTQVPTESQQSVLMNVLSVPLSGVIGAAIFFTLGALAGMAFNMDGERNKSRETYIFSLITGFSSFSLTRILYLFFTRKKEETPISPDLII